MGKLSRSEAAKECRAELVRLGYTDIEARNFYRRLTTAQMRALSARLRARFGLPWAQEAARQLDAFKAWAGGGMATTKGVNHDRRAASEGPAGGRG